MNPLAADKFDDLLADFPQPYPVSGDLRIDLDQAHDVSFGRIGVHAQQQIRRGQIEETEGMGLDECAAVEQSPEYQGGFRGMNAEDGIAGLTGGQRMTDRTDAADPFGDGRHLVVGPAFAQFLKPPELGDMKFGVTDAAVIVKGDGDHAMPFNAGDRFYGNRIAHCDTSKQMNNIGNHHAPNRVLPLISGIRPASSSDRR